MSKSHKSLLDLPNFSLDYNQRKQIWELINDQTGTIVESFENKSEALRGGVLEKAIENLGCVVIKKQDGTIQDERTFPHGIDSYTTHVTGEPTTRPGPRIVGSTTRHGDPTTPPIPHSLKIGLQSPWKLKLR